MSPVIAALGPITLGHYLSLGGLLFERGARISLRLTHVK